MEGLRGDDPIELRTMTLVMETLGAAVAEILASAPLGRKPQQPEAEVIIRSFLSRAEIISEQEKIVLEKEHLVYPSAFPLFVDAADRISANLKSVEPEENKVSLEARFRNAVTQSFNRIRIRRLEYFAPVIIALSGPDAEGDARSRAWEKYRSRLVQRFEDAPLFGQDENNGVTLGRVYQPLRAWWEEDVSEDGGLPSAADLHAQPSIHGRRVHLNMLEQSVVNWLHVCSKKDNIRFISGGPGSGKSTFAKKLAAFLAPDPRWRVIFVPLQRLKGDGPLENRIHDFFRLEYDEPFDAETIPLSSIGKDDHPDWVIIFDGLDELAREGLGSESAAQDFASALSDWRARISNTVNMRFIVLGRAPSMQQARQRLGLEGCGTLHIADMLPLTRLFEQKANKEVKVEDPAKLAELDQRAEFWTRWALAKGWPTELPEAMKAEELNDLTKEPLLAYLLIFSGYVGERWQEAAANRNHIYQAIFARIWERERAKQARMHLNQLEQDGFEAIMQALGIAAWRGGGRTGDEAAFTAIRDVFMRPDLLTRAKESGAADLGNVALLFYTRKDEEGGARIRISSQKFRRVFDCSWLIQCFP